MLSWCFPTLALDEAAITRIRVTGSVDNDEPLYNKLSALLCSALS